MTNLKSKKLFIFALLFFPLSYVFSQSEPVHQLSLISVLGSKSEAEIQFTVIDTEDDSKLITVLPFSYKGKSVDEFSFNINKINEGSFYTKNISVTACDGKEINILEAELLYSPTEKPESNLNPELSIKYKPGKMPFPIMDKKESIFF